MLTADWSSYAGPGRVAVSPCPGAPLGYGIHRGLFIRHPLTSAELRAKLATMDARATAAEIAALTYPWSSVIMGEAPAEALSYRTELARWFSFAGVHVVELDPEMYRPRRIHPASVPGLMTLLSNAHH